MKGQTVILNNHNPNEAIGLVYSFNGKLLFKFNEGTRITEEMFFEIFGCGAVFSEVEIEEKTRIIKAGEIVEFSLNDVADPSSPDMIKHKYLARLVADGNFNQAEVIKLAKELCE